MTIFLASLFLLASPHCTTSQIVRVYTLELSVGNEDIDVEFGADDDFPAIARHLVATEKLEAGEGCSSTDCVVDVLVSMMQRKTESGTGRSGVLNKVHAVYGRATEHFLREQAKENRQRSETHYRSTHGLNSRDRGGVTAGTGHFASVPCVPPFCSFECAAFPLDSSELDALASTPSPPSSGGFSPIDDVFGGTTHGFEGEHRFHFWIGISPAETGVIHLNVARLGEVWPSGHGVGCARHTLDTASNKDRAFSAARRSVRLYDSL